MLRALAQSITDGALYPYRHGGQHPDVSGMIQVASNFWAAVRDVFHAAWGLPPRKSRLLHGAGAATLGSLMDAIAHDREQPPPPPQAFADGLRLIAPHCRRDMGVRPALERHPEHQPGRRPAQRFPPPPVPAASPDGDRSPGRTPAMTKPRVPQSNPAGSGHTATQQTGQGRE